MNLVKLVWPTRRDGIFSRWPFRDHDDMANTQDGVNQKFERRDNQARLGNFIDFTDKLTMNHTDHLGKVGKCWSP